MFFYYLEKYIKQGQLYIYLPDGSTRVFGNGNPTAHWHIHNNIAIDRITRNYDMQLGEMYMQGYWSAGEGGLPRLFQVLMSNFKYGRSEGVSWITEKLLKLVQMGNRIAQSYRNISHHYDIDEWVFRHFLDEDMFYSCAYFENSNMNLEDAQKAKCRHIMNKLLLRTGDRVLDIGCGWGGMAFYLAEHADVTVVGLTLSKEQLRVAVNTAKSRGLTDKVSFVMQDYREHQGCYDRIVSVGMFEHVGVRHYPAFIKQLHHLLNDDGIALLHTIGSSDRPSKTNPWVEKYIFPGGHNPSLSELSRAIEASPLMTTDVEILRLHYADTLAEWLRRFHKNLDAIERKKSERFCRMWEFYLASCEGAFRWWDLVVFQTQLVKQHGIVPITRDYLMPSTNKVDIINEP